MSPRVADRELLAAWRALEAELRREVRATVGRVLPEVFLLEEDLTSTAVYGDGAPYYLLTVHLAERPAAEQAAAICLHPGALVRVAVGDRVLTSGSVPGREGEAGAQGGDRRKEPHPDED